VACENQTHDDISQKLTSLRPYLFRGYSTHIASKDHRLWIAYHYPQIPLCQLYYRFVPSKSNPSNTKHHVRSCTAMLPWRHTSSALELRKCIAAPHYYHHRLCRRATAPCVHDDVRYGIARVSSPMTNWNSTPSVDELKLIQLKSRKPNHPLLQWKMGFSISMTLYRNSSFNPSIGLVWAQIWWVVV